MKTFLILVCMCLVCAAAVTVIGQGKQTDSNEQLIERKYDRFKDETTVRLKPQLIIDSKSPRQVLEMSAKTAFKGEHLTESDEMVEITFISSGKLYRDPAELNFIVEKERVKGGPAITGNPYNPEKPLATDLRTAQNIRASISFDTLRKITSGKTVQMQLESTELALDTATLSNLRKFASVIFGKDK